MKLIKSLGYFGLLMKRVIETIKNKTKNKIEEFLVCYQVLKVQCFQGIYLLINKEEINK